MKGRSKSSSTKETLVIDIDLQKKRIDDQMTPDMNWSNFELDHVKPNCIFDVSKDKDLGEAFNWENTQPLLKQDHQLKETKFNFGDYQ